MPEGTTRSARDRIVARAAVDGVSAVVGVGELAAVDLDEHEAGQVVVPRLALLAVVAGAAAHEIGATATAQVVGAVHADQLIRAVAALDTVGAGEAEQEVVAAPAVERVVAGPSVHEVGPAGPVERVPARRAAPGIVRAVGHVLGVQIVDAGAARERITARPADQGVLARAGSEDVIALAATHERVGPGVDRRLVVAVLHEDRDRRDVRPVADYPVAVAVRVSAVVEGDDGRAGVADLVLATTERRHREVGVALARELGVLQRGALDSDARGDCRRRSGRRDEGEQRGHHPGPCGAPRCNCGGSRIIHCRSSFRLRAGWIAEGIYSL